MQGGHIFPGTDADVVLQKWGHPGSYSESVFRRNSMWFQRWGYLVYVHDPNKHITSGICFEETKKMVRKIL